MKQTEFLFDLTSKSLLSARPICEKILLSISPINTIVDLGCGLGAWTKAFEEMGVKDYWMIDHPTLSKDKLLPTDKEKFIPCDLDKSIPQTIKADLIICIEVLEHFKLDRGLKIAKYLTECSDLILFSAAVPNQKGCGHLNEQNHEYWHSVFSGYGYDYFDDFKPELFNLIQEENFFHAQNLFLYYNKQRQPKYLSRRKITSNGFEIRFNKILNRKLGIGELLRTIPSSLSNTIKFYKKKIQKKSHPFRSGSSPH